MAGVTFEDVNKIYPDGTRAVSDFDLEIQDGEFMVLVGLARGVERLASQRETGVVDEDVELAKLGERRSDERLAAVGVGDIELERDLGAEPVHPPRSACDAHAGICQRRRDRRADAAGRTGDDRRFSLEPHGTSVRNRRCLRLASARGTHPFMILRPWPA